MISTGWYKDMFDAFHRRFEVLEKNEYPTYGATDALLQKEPAFTLGDMETFFKSRRSTRPLPITCPKCKNETEVYHLEWSALGCPSCKEPVDKADWILGGF